MLYRAEKAAKAEEASRVGVEKSMNIELNPKLLDVVEFEDSSLGASVKRSGTVVETFGEPPSAVLIEIMNPEGVPESLVAKKVEEIKTMWEAKPPAERATPTEAQQYLENGFLYLQNGLIGRAKEQFAKAFSLDVDRRASLLESTNVLARRGKLDAAIRVYSLLLELQPEYELARENLAAAYVQRGVQRGRTGLLDQAIEDFKTALMLRPRRQESLVLIQKNLVAAYTHLAVQHSNMNLYAEAVAYFVFAFELEPSDPTQRNLALALIASAAAKTEGGSPVPSEDFFRQAIQMGLTLSQCLNAYGATLAHHGRISEATLALERAVRVDPKNEMARNNLETLLRQEPPGDLPTGLTPLETHEMHVAEA
jgi:tetratricopeptide (TPR) repeat protein